VFSEPAGVVFSSKLRPRTSTSWFKKGLQGIINDLISCTRMVTITIILGVLLCLVLVHESEGFIPAHSWRTRTGGLSMGLGDKERTGPGETEAGNVPQGLRSITRRRTTEGVLGGVAVLGTAAMVAFPQWARAAGAYEQLKEPTPEFKKEQAKVAEFKAKQAKIKASWDTTLDRFSATEDPKELEKELKALTAIVDDLHGIPVGVKKQATVKVCRLKKFGENQGRGKKKRPYWTKDVEIAYQAFILAYNRETNPDTTTRDTGASVDE